MLYVETHRISQSQRGQTYEVGLIGQFFNSSISLCLRTRQSSLGGTEPARSTTYREPRRAVYEGASEAITKLHASCFATSLELPAADLIGRCHDITY